MIFLDIPHPPVLSSTPMNAAAQTPGLNQPPTGVECLLAAARWLIALIFIHWIIACGHALAAAARRPSGLPGADTPEDSLLVRHFGTTDRARIWPRITRALRRAAALEAQLLARRPIEQGFSLETCRAIAAEMLAICRDLGMSRGGTTALKPTPSRRRRRPCSRRSIPRMSLARARRLPSHVTVPRPAATGPPRSTPLPRSARERSAGAARRERAQPAAQTHTDTRVYPWSLSGVHTRAFFPPIPQAPIRPLIRERLTAA